MKTCTKCNETKETDHFKKDPSSKDGLYSICRPCLTDRDREYNRNKRMFIRGKPIPKSFPLFKEGRYDSLDDAWSHKAIDETLEGHVYVVSNPAWEGYFKVGKAFDSKDRMRNFQTGSPYRDYMLHYVEFFNDRHVSEKAVHNTLKRMNIAFLNEWFYTDLETIKQVIEDVKSQEASPGHRNQPSPQLDLGLRH